MQSSSRFPRRIGVSLVLGLLFFAAISRGQDRAPVIEPPADAIAEWREERERILMGLSLDAAKSHSATPLRLEADPAKVADLHSAGAVHGPIPAGVVIPAGKSLSLADGASAKASGNVAGGYLNYDQLSWTYTVESPGAVGIRLRFEEFDLSKGVGMYLYSLGLDGPGAHGPYTLAGPDGTGSFWSPTLHDSTVYVELRATGGAALKELSSTRFVIAEAGHLAGPAWEPPAAEKNALEECGLTAACASSHLSGWNVYRHGVARLLYRDGGSFFVCTGSLIASQSLLPFLLTANHCIEDEEMAASVEATWDFFASSCGGSAPSPGQLPSTRGSTLLSTSQYASGTDHSLLLLSGPPPSGRTYLGYTTSSVQVGARLHRLHHPGGTQLHYERVDVISPRFNCQGLSQTRYIVGRRSLGVNQGGSSGSALINADGQIVGQLFGVCFANSKDDCGTNYDILDGRFSVSYPSMSSFLQMDVERPENRFFDNALPVEGTNVVVEGTNLHAEKEPGEPDHAGNSGGASVWYRWRAPQAGGTVVIETCGSYFDTLLAVYRGTTLQGLDLIAANDDACNLQSRVSFRVSPGAEYRIAVDGFGGAQGNIRLSIVFDADPLFYRLTAGITPSQAGQVLFDPMPSGPGFYQEGTTVSLTAIPSEGYRFLGWVGDATGANPATTVLMDRNREVFAVFAAITPEGPEGFQVY